MTGSFVAALYALIDFKAEFTELWFYLNLKKDYIINSLIKVYSILITNTDTGNIDKPDPNRLPKKKTILEEMIGSRSNTDVDTKDPEGFRNSYKNSQSNSYSSPIYKDWRVWAGGTIIVVIKLNSIP